MYIDSFLALYCASAAVVVAMDLLDIFIDVDDNCLFSCRSLLWFVFMFVCFYVVFMLLKLCFRQGIICYLLALYANQFSM